MSSQLLILVLLTVVSIQWVSSTNFDLSDLQVYDLGENDPCTVRSTNETGVCLHLDDCGYNVKLDISNVCGFIEKVSLICCPIERRVSAAKCEEYKKKYPLTINVSSSNGTVVESLEEQPHMARIGHKVFQFYSSFAVNFHCGGSLISEYFVITAAHCKMNKNGKLANLVRLGYSDDYDVKEIYIHPAYNFDTKDSDVALFKLDQIFNYTSYSSPACLRQYDDSEIIPVSVLGYGQSSNTISATSESLLKVDLSTVDIEKCGESYNDDDYIEIGASHICAHDPDGVGKDACLGDSGGPLQVTVKQNNGKSYHEVIGVTSFGIYCGNPTPGVYSRIFNFLDWIESVVWPEDV